jgi:hypothetical protein
LFEIFDFRCAAVPNLCSFAAVLRVKESVLRMKLMNKVLTLCSLGMLVAVLSCGHPKTLESITISPSSGGINGSGPVIPSGPDTTNYFKAYGNFINPTEVVDITNKVTWTTSTPAVATVAAIPDPILGEGVTATGVDCGTTVITAAAGKNVIGSGGSDSVAVVYATATYTVTDTVACTGGEPVLAVGFAGAGSGTVTGGGINCIDNSGGASGVCQEGFPAGSQVSLTATPTGASTFASWSGCTTVTGASCVVTLSGSGITSVTANFN